MNIATLRLAIKNVMADYGRRYPKGADYLRRLAELEDRQNAALRGSPEALREIEDALRSLTKALPTWRQI